MVDDENFNQILTKAYKRMHRYTCAEASLQALLELWGLPIEKNSWGTAGYLGAITSGETTCGLLIGSCIAMGLRRGHELKGVPEENDEARQTTIHAVAELYDAFLEKFGATNCKTLNQVDFRDGEQLTDWMIQKGWKNTCDRFLNFTMRKCMALVEEGKI